MALPVKQKNAKPNEPKKWIGVVPPLARRGLYKTSEVKLVAALSTSALQLTTTVVGT